MIERPSENNSVFERVRLVLLTELRIVAGLLSLVRQHPPYNYSTDLGWGDWIWFGWLCFVLAFIGATGVLVVLLLMGLARCKTRLPWQSLVVCGLVFLIFLWQAIVTAQSYSEKFTGWTVFFEDAPVIVGDEASYTDHAKKLLALPSVETIEDLVFENRGNTEALWNPAILDQRQKTLNRLFLTYLLLHHGCVLTFVVGVEIAFRVNFSWRKKQLLMAGRAPLPSPPAKEKPKVFVSHSSVDKPLVRRIVDELQKQNVNVWFDEHELGVGDSIVDGINTGLAEADYLLVVLSKNSVQSKWVKNELDSALMMEASNRAITVLPAVIDDCEIPPLLQHRRFADFHQNFDDGLQSLLRVFSQEAVTISTPDAMRDGDGCCEKLGRLKLAELRYRMTKRMSRAEIATVWHDVFEENMENDMRNCTLVECVIELLDRARNRKMLEKLIAALCRDRSDLADV